VTLDTRSAQIELAVAVDAGPIRQLLRMKDPARPVPLIARAAAASQ
jgi:hypothetical protein